MVLFAQGLKDYSYDTCTCNEISAELLQSFIDRENKFKNPVPESGTLKSGKNPDPEIR